jgi:tetratricopeptide (TPR) repeat protein
MLVTLPFVLLLLDYWPLGRLELGQSTPRPTDQTDGSSHAKRPWAYLILEKLPMIALSAAFCVVAYVAQAGGGAIKSASVFPMNVRVLNALIAYVSYIGKTIWPQNLAVFYPHPGLWPTWQVAGAVLLLLTLSAVVVLKMRQLPYLTFGWMWYLGTLVPVIGLVQVGDHAMADRYTYVPIIGLFIIIAWAAQDLSKGWRRQRLMLSVSAVVVLCLCAWTSVQQTKHWRDSHTLFEHALRVTSGNHVAHTNLGLLLAGQGELDEALDHYAEALRIKPDLIEARMNMGAALAEQGKLQEALLQYRKVLELKPGFAGAHYNLGNLLTAQGDVAQAAGHFREALRIEPNDAEAHNNLGITLAKAGNTEEAADHFEEALRINPHHEPARKNLEMIRTERTEDM